MKLTFLEPDEEPTLERVSKSNQYRDTFSVLKGGEWTPIQFDVLDYIGCKGIRAHRAILANDDFAENNQEGCAYYVQAEGTIKGESGTAGSLLLADENPEVFYRSSIAQHENKLSVMQRGEWVPLSYDVLDYIDCDKVASHKAVVTDGDDIGYDFKVEERVYYTDKYIYHDREETVLKELPHWFGEGFYEAFVDETPFVNADNGALGIKTKRTLRVGTPYALAIRTLEPDD